MLFNCAYVLKWEINFSSNVNIYRLWLNNKIMASFLAWFFCTCIFQIGIPPVKAHTAQLPVVQLVPSHLVKVPRVGTLLNLWLMWPVSDPCFQTEVKKSLHITCPSVMEWLIELSTKLWIHLLEYVCFQNITHIIEFYDLFTCTFLRLLGYHTHLIYKVLLGFKTPFIHSFIG